MSRIPDELRDIEPEDYMVGQTQRFHHMECSNHKYDRTLSITRIPDGILFYCYRCGVRGIISHSMNPLSASKYLKRRMDDSVRSPAIIELPWDFHPMCDKPNRIPAKAYAWLYKYELEDSDLCDYNIGFSNKLQRVILPIYHAYELVGWVGRDIHYVKGYKGQKYHNEFKGGGRVFFSTYDNNSTISDSNKQSWVFVEDILSAIKCSKATGFPCIALLNTSIGDSTIRHLMEGHVNYLWLDEDARTKALRQIFKYKQHGINITTIYTNRDPKAIPLKEIPNKLLTNPI